jgi:hypothetical protein
MAITDMKGTVSTTGMMNQPVRMPEGKVNPQLQTGGSQPLPEDPTKPVNPFAPKPTGPVLPNKEIAQNQNNTTFQGTTNLTDEDMETINAALSPSVKTALGKVFPDLKSTIDQLGTNEPNVIIPLSVATRYATSKYGGETESDALTNFMTDMMSPEINAADTNQMETQQTNVPPGNEPQGLMTSPQNMETV